MKWIPSKCEVDVVVVLGARSVDTPSPAIRRRIYRGIAVFREANAKHLLLCGGSSGKNAAEAVVMATIACKAGIKQDRIVTESRSVSTWENALFSSALIEHYGWQSACIVSDSFHLPRAWLVFRKTPLKIIYLESAGPLPIFLAVRMWVREAVGIIWYLLRQTITRR